MIPLIELTPAIALMIITVVALAMTLRHRLTMPSEVEAQAMATGSSGLLGFIDRFVPPEYKIDPTRLSRARSLVTCGLCAAAMTPLHVLLHWHENRLGMSVSVAALGIALVSNNICFRSHRRLGWAAMVVLTSQFAFFGLNAVLTGGVRSFLTPWMVALPTVAYYIGGRRLGLYWSVLLAGWALLMGLADAPLQELAAAHTQAFSMLSLRVVDLVVPTLITALFAYLFELTKSQGYRQLDASRRHAEDMALHVQQLLDQVSTERALAEQAKERYRNVIDNVSEGIVVVQKGYVVFANPAMERIIGESTAALGTRRLSRWVHPEDWPAIRDWQSVAAGRKTLSQRARMRLINSEHAATWIEASIVPVQWEGAPATLSFVTDITQRVHLEHEVQVNLAHALAAKEQADAANRSKSEFLAVMSHELRTPLAGVIGLQSIALRDRQLPDAAREKIRLAQGSAQSLLTIANNLLDLSKIEAGKLKLEAIDYDLSDVVNALRAIYTEQAAGKSLFFSIAVDSNMPRWLLGDPTRLRQILVNLIGNALKFTQHGGVAVEVHLIALDAGVAHTRFVVRDTGIGIAADAISRLFQKFEQADTSTTRKFGGTGLGLSISRQLVQMMGGDITVHSQLGAGSSFAFDLPLALGQAAEPAAAAAHVEQTHQLNVLCAEDFYTNQVIIRTLLQDMGHTVTVVDNGVAAVRAMSQSRFDAILMDGRMPEMDGMEATRLIRGGGTPEMPVPQRDIFIVALTANAGADDRNCYLASGMNAFLTKPVDEFALEQLMSQVIAQRLADGARLKPLLRASEQALDSLFKLDDSMPNSAPTPPAPATTPPASSLRQETLQQAYSIECPQRLTQLHDALAAGDAERAALVLHGLKGGASYIDNGGELHVLLGQLELAAMQNQCDAITHELPRLLRLLSPYTTSPQAENA